MKYFPLLWATLWRKKARTIFTLLSIVIAFLLFGMLQGVNAAFQQGVNNANVNRLIVASRISLTEPLPISQKQQIEAVRSEEHTSELQSLMRNSYAVFCLKKKIHKRNIYKKAISKSPNQPHTHN